MTFNWTKAFGFGFLIWAIMFILAWVTIAGGIFGSVWTQIVLAAIAGLLTYFLAAEANASDLGPAFGYGAMFVVVGMVLDAIISQQLVSGLYGLWTYYLTYALILFAPSVELGLRGSPSATVPR